MTIINDDPTQLKQYITNLLSIIEEAVGSDAIPCIELILPDPTAANALNRFLLKEHRGNFWISVGKPVITLFPDYILSLQDYCHHTQYHPKDPSAVKRLPINLDQLKKILPPNLLNNLPCINQLRIKALEENEQVLRTQVKELDHQVIALKKQVDKLSELLKVFIPGLTTALPGNNKKATPATESLNHKKVVKLPATVASNDGLSNP
jgi:hypothetical protein